MSDGGLEKIAEIVAACQQNAAETASALERTFGSPATLSPEAPLTLAEAQATGTIAGAGVAVALPGAAGAVVLLSEQGGFIPAWCAQPDPTGRSKLATLAQELGMLLLPESLMPDDFQAGYTTDLAAALTRSEPAEGATAIPLGWKSPTGMSGVAWLVWPVQAASQAIAEPQPPQPAASAPAAASTSPSPAAPLSAATAPEPPNPAAPATPRRGPHAWAVAPPKRQPPQLLSELPSYSQNLLRIHVPVVVTLASARQTIEQIVSLGPGAIIQFRKSCEEPIELEVGGRVIAEATAVRVGDLYGARITSIVLPPEDFIRIQPQNG